MPLGGNLSSKSSPLSARRRRTSRPPRPTAVGAGEAARETPLPHSLNSHSLTPGVLLEGVSDPSTPVPTHRPGFPLARPPSAPQSSAQQSPSSQPSFLQLVSRADLLTDRGAVGEERSLADTGLASICLSAESPSVQGRADSVNHGDSRWAPFGLVSSVGRPRAASDTTGETAADRYDCHSVDSSIAARFAARAGGAPLTHLAVCRSEPSSLG